LHLLGKSYLHLRLKIANLVLPLYRDRPRWNWRDAARWDAGEGWKKRLVFQSRRARTRWRRSHPHVSGRGRLRERSPRRKDGDLV